MRSIGSKLENKINNTKLTKKIVIHAQGQQAIRYFNQVWDSVPAMVPFFESQYHKYLFACWVAGTREMARLMRDMFRNHWDKETIDDDTAALRGRCFDLLRAESALCNHLVCCIRSCATFAFGVHVLERFGTFWCCLTRFVSIVISYQIYFINKLV